MTYLIICIVAFLGSALTFFSGFGLGTLLVPVFTLFFPIELAIGLTAVVHFLNNLFKLALVGKAIDKIVILRFGIPAIMSSLLGAYLLVSLSQMQPIYEYQAFGKSFTIMPVKLITAILILIFALFDIIPYLTKLNFDKRLLPLGGLLTGFFGGLSGNQGALRTAFLTKANLTKEALIATGVFLAVLIDIARLAVYSGNILNSVSSSDFQLIALATLSAFSGAYLGNKFLKKITVRTLHTIIGITLIVFAILLGMGII